MNVEGPQLAVLLHHLTECPSEFFLPPRTHKGGVVVVDAVLSDVLRLLGSPPLAPYDRALLSREGTEADINYLKTILIACWLLSHEWFAGHSELASLFVRFVQTEAIALADIVRVEEWVASSDRREEMLRLVLASLDLRPQGESPAVAEDRLAGISTIGRLDVIRSTLAALERMRRVREAMAKKAAEEAAAKVSRE